MHFGTLRDFVEGPLLWMVFIIFFSGIAARLGLFISAIIKNTKNTDSKCRYILISFGRSLLPFHNAVRKNPIHSILKYIFHLCLFIVPICLIGHVALWEESRFGWSWASLPDAWADLLTLLVLVLAVIFILRRIILAEVRRASSTQDYLLITITALPFLTGYFLAHGSLEFAPFLENNLWTIHVLSGEVILLAAAFLFCRTRLAPAKCTGCTACVLSCPTGTLEFNDKGNLRTFSYSHYQCICCGTCVKSCPEDAAELRHEISPVMFFQISPKKEIQSVELETCQRCNAVFAPKPQLEKIIQTVTDDYVHFCPRCRAANLLNVVHGLAPTFLQGSGAGLH